VSLNDHLLEEDDDDSCLECGLYTHWCVCGDEDFEDDDWEYDGLLNEDED
jgi:hypothetical protein